MDTSLPLHARLIARSDVWLESAAVEQLAAVASRERCVAAVGMPDLHPGRGIPIGAAFLFEGRVQPALVGSDAGCGVLFVPTRRDGPTGDALERRVRAAWDEPPLEAPLLEAIHRAALRGGPRAIADVDGVPASLAALALELADDGPTRFSDDVYARFEGHAASLGTVGGGNHFAEVVRIDRLHDRARARAHGCARDALGVLIHTGSRGLGAALAARWGEAVLEGDSIQRYLDELTLAVRWARTNRLLLAHRLLTALGAAPPARRGAPVDLVHNTVAPTAAGYLHRKGAAPAALGQPTIVLGSRGAPSHLLEGLGNEECLECVAHGAGRRMGRSEARAKLRAKVPRKALTRTRLGGRVLCDDPSLMYEEHPDAYKPIDPVVASLIEAGAALHVAELVPLLTVKR